MSQCKEGEKMAHTCIDHLILSSALLYCNPSCFSENVEESESEVSSPKQESPEKDCECLFCTSVQQLESVYQKGGRYSC